MASDSDRRNQSIPLLIGAVVIAASVWGLYAWRATRASTSTNDAVQVASKEPEASPKVTPLAATRPIPEIIKKIEAEQKNAPAPESIVPDPVVTEAAMSSVRANAPPSEHQSMEMTIGKNSSSTTPPGNLEMGRSALVRGDVIEGRKLLSASLDRGLPSQEEDFVRKELSRLSDALLFSRATNTNDPLTDVHTIGPGDTLHGLAARYKVTEELLASINKIAEPSRLQVGQRVKLIRGPFRAVIDKSDHRMDLFLGDVLVRSFAVGLGSNGYTPTGTWVVNNKLRDPDWTDPTTNRHYNAGDPENPIGKRWIGLSGVDGDALGKTGFGIHGTIDPTSIGQNKSMGCVRLPGPDVNVVFDLMVLNESRVVIRP